MTEHQLQSRATWALFLGASIWGLYWLPLRELARMGIDGAWGVALFNGCPLLVLVPVLIWKRRVVWANPGPAVFVGAASGVGLALYSTSIVMAPVIRMTMEFYLTSVWSTIIGVVWLSERLDLRRIFTVVAGLLGLFLLLSGASDLETSGLGLGDVLAISSGVLWALGAAGLKRWPGAHVLTTSTLQFFFSTLGALLIALFVLQAAAPSPGQILTAFPMAFSASSLILLPSVLAIFWACRIVYPGRAAILMMSEALVATLSASLLLPEETMTALQWAGGAIVLLACLLGS